MLRKRVESQFHCAYNSPFPRPVLLSAKRELPGSKEFPSPIKGSGVSNHLPQPLRALHKRPTPVSPHPEMNNAETSRERYEQDRREGTTYCQEVGANAVLSCLLSRRPWQPLPLRISAALVRAAISPSFLVMSPSSAQNPNSLHS